jgi:hypothetical protein
MAVSKGEGAVCAAEGEKKVLLPTEGEAHDRPVRLAVV